MSILRERVTWVWLALLAGTAVSTWLLSQGWVSPGVAVVGTFGIAAVKARFVMLDFMGLRDAPRAARAVTGVWIVVVTLLILAFWFAS